MVMRPELEMARDSGKRLRFGGKRYTDMKEVLSRQPDGQMPGVGGQLRQKMQSVSRKNERSS